MPKFKKKPVVIEAVNWDGKKLESVPVWLADAFKDEKLIRLGDTVNITTLEGTMTASPGDWIIQGVNGEIYPCKPDIFEKTYEPVEVLV